MSLAPVKFILRTLVLFPVLYTQASADIVDGLVQQGDVLFNQGRFREAQQLYDQAMETIGDDPRQRLLLCELIQNTAAVLQATGEQNRFYTKFKLADRCKRAAGSPKAEPDLGNLLVNGGFEDGLIPPWGTGHYESDTGKTAFGIWWNSMNARAFMKVDTDRPHAGRRSLRITNYSPSEPHVFTTSSQRIRGLTPNTLYKVTMYVKAEDLSPGALSFAIDAAWTKRLPALRGGTYDWQPYSATINIGHNTQIDFRIIHLSTGSAWLDDIVIQPAQQMDDLQAELQHAESLLDQARFEEALTAYEDLQKRHPDNASVQWQTRRHIGRIHLATGRYQAALTALVPLAEQGHRPLTLDLGDLYSQLGEYDKAETWYRKALKYYEGDQGTTSLVLERLAANHLAQGRTKAAQRAQQQSLRILRHIGDRHGEATALDTLGRIQLREGEEDQAAKSFATAAALARSLDDRRLLADALHLLGETTRRRGHDTTAIDYVDEALALRRAVGDRRGEVESLYLRARLQRQTGRLKDARADFRAAAQLLGEIYARLGGAADSTRQAFLSQFDQFYRDYVDLLLELHEFEGGSLLRDEAFRVAEEARARSFTEMVAETRVAQVLAAGSDDPRFASLLDQERTARLAISELERRRGRLRGDASGAAREALEQGIAEAEQRALIAFAALVDAYPRYAELRRPEPLSLTETQSLLEKDEALLAFFVTDKRTGVWALTRETADLRVISGGRKALAPRVRSWLGILGAPAKALEALAELPRMKNDYPSLEAYYAALEPRRKAWERVAEAFGSFDQDTAYALYKDLIGPLDTQLETKRLVYIVPDDLLYRIPFETLMPSRHAPEPPTREIAGELNGAPFWIARQNLAYLPGAAVLRSLRRLDQGEVVERQPLLAFADPVFESEDESRGFTRGLVLRRLSASGALPEPRLSRLANTAQEARAAAKALGGAEEHIYLREQASERNVKQLPLRNYRHLLFATHGLLAGEFGPGVQPALALSFVGDPENDGLLEMGEVLALDLDADLVVLSACNTGASATEADHGAGYSGLTRSFMYAGADTLVVTLWSVHSQAAENLMSDFYRSLKETPRAEALGDAKRSMIGENGRLMFDENRIAVSTAHPFFWAPFVLVGEGK